MAKSIANGGATPLDDKKNLTPEQVREAYLLTDQTPDSQRNFLQEHGDHFSVLKKKKVSIEKLSDEKIKEMMDAIAVQIAREVELEEKCAAAVAELDYEHLDEVPRERLQAIVDQYVDVITRYDLEGHSLEELCEKLGILFNRTVQQREALREKLRKERIPPMKFQCLHEESFRTQFGFNQDVLPNAFIQNGVIYFNIDHPSFRDPVYGEMNMDRAVTHEVTHLVSKSKPERDKALFESAKNTLPWNELKAEVGQYLGRACTEQEAFDEALAIYCTQRYPSSVPQTEQEVNLALQTQEKIASIFDDVLQAMPPENKRMLEALQEDIKRNRTLVDFDKDGKPVDLLDRVRESVREGRELNRRNGLYYDETVKDVGEFKLNNAPEAEELDRQLSEQQKESARDGKSIDQTLEQLSKNRTTLFEVYAGMDTVKKYVEQSFSGQQKDTELAAVNDMMNQHSEFKASLTQMEGYLEHFKNWKNTTVAQKKEIFSEVPTELNPYAELTDDSSDAEKQEADRKAAPLCAKFIAVIKNTNNQIAEALKEQEALVKRAGEASEKIVNPTQSGPPTGPLQWLRSVFMPGANGTVMWVTPSNIMKTFAIWRDAIVENYNSNQSLKQYNLAKKFNILPHIDHTLKKQAKSANEKESSEFKEYIEREGFTFDELFGKGGKGEKDGLLYQNRHNFNRFKAVLLYAADRAWLYHLDRYNGKNVYGVDYEELEGKKSFDELIDQQEAGKKKEEERGIAKVDKVSDIVPMIRDMREELEKKNIFAVRGIMKRIQGKGKIGESNTWASVELAEAMRNSKEIQEIVDKGFLDNVGNIGIGESAWTMTLFKFSRHAFGKFKEGKGAIKSIDEGNLFFETITKIKNKLKEGGMKEVYDNNGFSTDDLNSGLNRAIGRVLAGQSVKVGGRVISIFQSDFDEYRKFWETTPTTTDPGKTDDDFFSPGNDGSDPILLPKSSIQKILLRTSTGLFQYESKAPTFMGMIFHRYDQLKQTDPVALRNFRTGMKRRLVSTMRAAVSHAGTNQQFAGDVTPDYPGELAYLSDNNILVGLWRRRLIEDNEFLSLALTLKRDNPDDPSIAPELRAVRKKHAELQKEKEKLKVALAKAESATGDGVQTARNDINQIKTNVKTLERQLQSVIYSFDDSDIGTN